MLLVSGQKLYPSSGATHAALEATRAAAAELGCTPAEVASITILGFREMVGVLGTPFPPSALAATMSTPFIAACAVRDGTFDLSHLVEAQLADPVLRRLQEVTELQVDDRLDALPPRHLGARATITTTDGQSATVEVLAASGHPGNPLTLDQVEQKVRRLHDDAGTTGFDVEALRNRCIALPDGDVRTLMQHLRGA